MPTVSVQIVTYNSEKDIVPCIDSVFSQTYPVEKVIIIDNSSSDKTLEIIRNIPGIAVVDNKINNGFAGGHNQGISYTSTDYVLVLNPDVRLHKDYIKSIIEKMETNKQIGMATGKLYRNIQSKVLDSTGISIKKNRRVFDRGSGELDKGQYDNLLHIFGVSGAAAVYRRKMIEDITMLNQFFDETFFAYKEDVDVSWRAQLYGWRSVFVPEAIAEHARGWQEKKNRNEIPLFIRQKSYINRYYYILKNDDFLYILLHFPFIIVYDLAMVVFALIKEPKLLLVWKTFFKSFNMMLKKRKTIKARKRANDVYVYFKGIW